MLKRTTTAAAPGAPRATSTGPSNRGSAWGTRGDLDRAIADYNQAIRLDPKDTKAYYNRGIAWEKKRSLQAALADFKVHAQLAPSDPDGLKAVKRVSKELSAR